MSKKIVTKQKTSEYEEFLKEVQKKSYEIYLRRTQDNLSGDQLSDWLKAESEMKTKYHVDKWTGDPEKNFRISGSGGKNL